MSVISSTSSFSPADVGIYPGDWSHFSYYGPSTPGTEQTVITTTVPSGKTRNLYKIVVDSPIDAVWKILVNGSVEMSGRLDAGGIFGDMQWTPPKKVSAGIQIDVKVTLRNSSVNPTIGVYLMASDI